MSHGQVPLRASWLPIVGSFIVGSLAAGCGGNSASTNDLNASTYDGGGATDGPRIDLLPTDGGARVTDGGLNVPCTSGLCTQQVSCPAGTTTTLTGKVMAPNGTLPLYNVAVYVPNEAVASFPEGVTCDRCGTLVTGAPIVSTISGTDGSFKLENVPVGSNIPIVFQVGKWRRQISVPAVEACKTQPIDVGQTRLPRSRAEGDLPQIAVTTGSADSLECLLRELGIADTEFTNPSGPGRVHLYSGHRAGQGGRGTSNGSSIDANTPSANALWDDLAELKKHDIVVLSCEGNENMATKSRAALQNMLAYANAGGRIFASHYHYAWIDGDSPFPPTGVYGIGRESDGDFSVDTSFPKGNAFAEWLVSVGASATVGTVPLKNVRSSVSQLVPPTQRWVHEGNRAQYISFNTPVGQPVTEQCGRTVYTGIHVSSEDFDVPNGVFPAVCARTNPQLTPQEKALIFLLFDLSSCVQEVTEAPKPPPITILR